MKLKAGLIVLLSALAYHLQATNMIEKACTEWNLARRNNNISLYYRWLKLDNGQKTREIKAIFEINATVEKIIPQFTSNENFSRWAVGIKECGIEQFNDTLWYTYTVMNYPWPFKEKDLITRYAAHNCLQKTTLNIEAVPNFRADIPGIERIKNYEGTWEFYSNKNRTTRVVYQIVSFEKPMFPRIIQDPVVQKILIKSLNELKQLVEAN